MLYNKYRPQEFKDVIGQDHVINIVSNALEKERLGQAIMLSGTHGTGKTTIARLIAKQVGCIAEDINEIDAASNNSVEDARQLVRMARVPPHQQKRAAKKVYIIDEAHMYSQAAFNSLLKIIEEPPKHCIFIFCTTEPEKLLPTIKSRCMSLFLKAIDSKIIRDYLTYVCSEENISFDKEALVLISDKANGSMRDALSDLELCRDRCLIKDVEDRLGLIPTTTFIKLMESIGKGAVTEVMLAIEEIHRWHEANKVVDSFISFLHQLFWCKGPDTAMLLNNSEELNLAMINLVKQVGVGFCFQLLNTMHKVIYRDEMSNKAIRISLEISLIKATQAMKKKSKV